jgi:hypothetical protein
MVYTFFTFALKFSIGLLNLSDIVLKLLILALNCLQNSLKTFKIIYQLTLTISWFQISDFQLSDRQLGISLH